MRWEKTLIEGSPPMVATPFLCVGHSHGPGLLFAIGPSHLYPAISLPFGCHFFVVFRHIIVVKEEVLDFTLDLWRSDAGVVAQPRPVAYLGIEYLVGCECFVLFYERKDVERHLIIAAPRHIADAVGKDGRHNVDILLEYGCGADGERRPCLKAGNAFYGVEIKFVHKNE